MIIVIFNHLHSESSVRKLRGLDSGKVRNKIGILMGKEKKCPSLLNQFLRSRRKIKPPSEIIGEFLQMKIRNLVDH